MSGIGEWFKKLGIYGYLLVGLLIIVAAYFIIIHQAHLAAYSTIIFIVIFIGIHIFMHAGHGSHGGHGGGNTSGRSHEEHEQHHHSEGTNEEEDI